MLFVFECPTCGARIEADASVSGRQAHCPQCQGMVAVPESRVSCGTTLGGFRLERRLGKGGMGEVFLATQLSVDRQVAVKVLPPSFAADREAVARFLHEGRLAARLDHATIVTVYEAGEDGGNYYLAMAYVEGESLDQRLKRDGALPEREALAIVRAIAEALCYAWDEFQLLHRDLKPANIMLDRRGRVFLMDLGLAKSLGEETGMTMSGAILGTPHYMSPEQAVGSSQLSVQTDIYALGATLYHLVVGSPPFSGDSTLKVLNQHVHEALPPPRSRNPQVSEACSALIGVMMAKAPRDRYPGWRELIADTDRVLSGTAPAAPVPAGAGGSGMTRTAELARQAQAALARQHQAEALSRSGAASRSGTASRSAAAHPSGTASRSGTAAAAGAAALWRRLRRRPWAAAAAAAVALLLALAGALARRGRGDERAALPAPPAAAPAEDLGRGQAGQTGQTGQASQTSPTGQASPTGQTSPTGPPAEPAPAPAQAAPASATAAPPAPPAAVPPVAVPPVAVPPVAVPAVPAARPPWDRIALPHSGDWALEFDGGDDSVTVPDLVWTEAEPLTLEAVFSPAPSLPGPVFVAGRSGGAGAMWLAIRDGSIIVRRQVGDGSVVTAAAPLARPGAVHVAGIWDGKVLRLYANGVLAATADPAAPRESGPGVPGKAFVVGSHPGTVLKGRVEAVRVSRGVRYTEDFDLESALPFKPDTDTLCLLDFEEGTGDVTKDSSGNGHHGQIHGAEWSRQWPCPLPEETLRGVEEALRQANPVAADLAMGVEGLPGGIAVTIRDATGLADIAPLASLPVLELDLLNTGVVDLSPLRGTRLGWLNLADQSYRGGITDLSPLQGLALAGVILDGHVALRDLSPLKGAPLRFLSLMGVPVADLSPLAGAPLVGLSLGWDPRYPNDVKDLSVLRGMPLKLLAVPTCAAVKDITPILGCPDLEALWTPTRLPVSMPDLTATLKRLVHVNVRGGAWEQAAAYRRGVRFGCREAWRKDLESVTVTATQASASLKALARAVLAGRVDEALQRWREGGEDLSKGLTDDERQRVSAQLEALAGMEARLLASFKADADRTIEIALARETIRGEVREVAPDGIRFNQVVQHGQSTGRLGRVIRLDDLGIAERLRRLGSADTPELNLQRGLLALEAAKPEVAGKLFAKAGGPLGEAMAAALAVSQAEAREVAAEQAVADLLRQISTSPRLESRDRVIASVRKRCSVDARRAQAARKAVAQFEKEWGDTAAGREWLPTAKAALLYPCRGEDWMVPDLALEFVWIEALRLWVGRYEVTNGQYRVMTPGYNAELGWDKHSLAGDRQPVCIDFPEAKAYAQWLSDRESRAGRGLPALVYRLPTGDEWTAFAQCGDQRAYPWGNPWPPPSEWNYNGEEGAHPTNGKIAGHRDAFPVTAPVERSGRNDWGLFGVGGNVWEYTIKADGAVDALRGASWDWSQQHQMRCDSRLPTRAWHLHAGFRLVLAPPAAAAAP